jgi:hypothetical protein
MGMMQQILAPGVKDAEKADISAEMFGIARDGEQGFTRGAEQNAVYGLLVVKGDAGDGFGQREDNVEVFDWQ